MSFAFDRSQGPVIVEASLSGPTGQADVRLVLDTGATTSLIRSTILEAIGYEPQSEPNRVTVAMGSGIEQLPQITLNRMSALGRHRVAFQVLAHTLPSATGIDGLLGLDFLRGTLLTLDFRVGQITLV
jgi:predicted aspartyl protease